MFIQTEETPNPLAMKFLPGRTVLAPEDGTLIEYADPEEAERSPLAEDLFSIEGVVSVFLGPDFVTVIRDEDVEWDDLKPLLLEVIMDHFLSDRPVLLKGPTRDTPVTDEEIVAEIQEILETRIRPVVKQDGGDIVFDRYEDGVVHLAMRGACSGCPNALVTLKMGVERVLKHFIPEIKEVRRVSPHDHS